MDALELGRRRRRLELTDYLFYMIRVPVGYYRAEGMIKNVNTMEEYQDMDKPGMLMQAGKTVSIHYVVFDI